VRECVCTHCKIEEAGGYVLVKVMTLKGIIPGMIDFPLPFPTTWLWCYVLQLPSRSRFRAAPGSGEKRRLVYFAGYVCTLHCTYVYLYTCTY
jgi:hypothetical protein